jgi:chorismate mutase
MTKEIADAAAQLKAQAGKAHDHPDREAIEQAIDFLAKVGKARLVTETLGL